MRRVLLLVPLLALATGCASSLTADALGPSFGSVFSALYVQQQTDVGRTDVIRSALRPLASCHRTGSAPAGPGEDWVCLVQYVDGSAAVAQSFEVQVKPDGCWKADGPPATQPAQFADPLTGLPRNNPLAEFDGCLDTSW